MLNLDKTKGYIDISPKKKNDSSILLLPFTMNENWQAESCQIFLTFNLSLTVIFN